MSFLSAIFDPVLRPLLNIHPVLAILIVSIIVSVISVLMQKFLTDQKKMKMLKEEIKETQKLIKQHKDNPKKMLELQKKMMQPQMQLMKESFKPLLFTTIPFLLLFVWLAGHFSYLPIEAGEEFNVTVFFAKDVSGNATLEVMPEMEFISEKTQFVNSVGIWRLKAKEEGDYTLKVSFGGVEYNKDIKISNRDYTNPLKTYAGSVKKILISNEPLKPLGDFNLLGLGRPSWIIIYIVFSLIITTLLRKILGVV